MKSAMKFCVFTDLHYDIIHDGDRRIRELILDCKQKNVDFVIELGDLCYPLKENRKLLSCFSDAGLLCCYSLGNHNMDTCDYKTTLHFFGQEKEYYTLVQGNIKFVFLNANYVKTEHGYLPKDRAYIKNPTDQYPYLPPEQIKWLEEVISDNQYYYVICSHQSLANDFSIGSYSRGIINREEIRKILENQNAVSHNILFCMNGHDHGDSIKFLNGIYYYSLNSSSYIWHGVKQTFYYSEEIHSKYPYLKDMILYEEPLHIIVTIDEKANVTIDGMNGHYQNVTPQDIGIGNTWNGVSIKPVTSSLYIPRQQQ